MPGLLSQIDVSRLPEHIAIIMDGNGRWAQQQGQHRIMGHQSGVNAVRHSAEACAELGVNFLTLYAFSTENWARPQSEVQALMGLLVHTIHQEMKTLMDNNISLHAIGDLEKLPDECHGQLRRAIEETSGNTGLRLVLALSYSARWDILQAVNTLLHQARTTGSAPSSVNEEIFKSYLSTAGMPDPELLIRTSGEQRISNFLLWEIAYTELYFCRKMWPDFDKEDLYGAIVEYQARDRRFGLTGEKVNV